MIDRVEFMKILATLAALYPRFKLEPETVEAYYAVLGDLDVNLLKAATLQIGSEPGPWFPSAGDLRARAFKLVEQEEGALTPGEAWAEAKKMVLRNHWPGHDLAPKLTPDVFSDPLVYDALLAVGGPEVLRLPAEVEHTTRARFMQSFQVLQQRRRTSTAMLPQVRKVVAVLSAGDKPELEAGS